MLEIKGSKTVVAIKKSDLYSSLWQSCDEFRGGMDASQYKDYVLFMLFIKYISDKYGDSTDFALPVTIPKGASFTDMLELRVKSDIGDRISTHVIAPLGRELAVRAKKWREQTSRGRLVRNLALPDYEHFPPGRAKRGCRTEIALTISLKLR